MNILTKAARSLSAMLHAVRPAFSSWFLRRTRFDYREAIGDCLDSSVVTAPVQFIQRSLPEARLTVERRQRGGKLVDQPDHEMLKLIQKPNGFYGDIALWFATVLSFCIAGNAYWLKVRNGYGKVVELWYVPHWMMMPVAPQDGSTFIGHYLYTPGGGAGSMEIDPNDVVHFRHGIDPRNMRLGLSPIDGAIREIFMDLESSNFVASLLRNMGVPGVVISPKGGAMPAPQDVEATKAWFQQAFGGDNRGGPLVMGAPTEVSSFGFNPQQMNMSEGRDVAEERVCACLGIPAAIVGFGAGLQQSKVGATMTEHRKLAWHNGILPIARALADELGRSLLPDFGDPTGLSVGWDTDHVLALQDEEDQLDKRWNARLATGAITVYDWKGGIGLPASDKDRYYLRPINLIEVPENGGPAVAPTSAVPALPAPKQSKAAQASQAAYKRGAAYTALLDRQAKGLSKAFERPLRGLFADLAKAAGEAALPLLQAQEPKARNGGTRGEKADELLIAQIMVKLGMPAWAAALSQAYQAHYLDVAGNVQDAAQHIGLGTSLPDPVARAIVASGGRRAGLVDLDAQTRQAVYDALTEGRSEGEGADALAARIVDHVDSGPWSAPEIRAQVIARTETKFAQNISTIERAKAAGVTHFIVFDGRLGPGRSQPSHIERNGEIVDAPKAELMAETEHPNGTLSFAPHFQE